MKIFLFVLCVLFIGLVSSRSIEVTSATFKREVLDKKDQAVFVLFHANWCGHCKKLMPDFEKAAERLKGLVTFAKVESSESDLMRKYGIEGYPTMKMFAPVPENSPTQEKKVIPFQRQRTINSISQFVLSYLPNYVDSIEEESWFETESKKVILFPSKKFNTIPPLFKGVARDFKKHFKFGIIFGSSPVSEKLAESFGIVDFPKVLLIEEKSEQVIEVFDQKLSLQSIHSFLKKHVTNVQGEEGSGEEAGKQKVNKKKKVEEEIMYIHEVGMEKYGELCTGSVSGFCAIGLFDKDDQENYKIYETVAKKFYKDKLFTFVLLNEGQDEIKSQLKDLTGKDTLDFEIIVIRPKRSRWTIFDGDFENETQLQTFFEKIITGDMRFKNSQIKKKKVQNDNKDTKEL
ncbi:protein disulfide-isomerase a6 [Anaeramoeba flamelloides]|uniref:protein disulfide-isomerase n=1 Tax=Anaeramoeba flamelloides TaxID=1746091 RepID=A0ABQ8Y776_9EUKA|nr:protein disulfide-isomerase a6 [Anaeramoeba flamelloides]